MKKVKYSDVDNLNLSELTDLMIKVTNKNLSLKVYDLTNKYFLNVENELYFYFPKNIISRKDLLFYIYPSKITNPRHMYKVIYKNGLSLYIKDPKYSINYEKNRVIETINTLGVFGYKEEENAKYFSKFDHSNRRVIKLLALDKIKKMKYISGVILGRSLDDFYENSKYHRFKTEIEGILCSKVLVLN